RRTGTSTRCAAATTSASCSVSWRPPSPRRRGPDGSRRAAAPHLDFSSTTSDGYGHLPRAVIHTLSIDKGEFTLAYAGKRAAETGTRHGTAEGTGGRTGGARPPAAPLGKVEVSDLTGSIPPAAAVNSFGSAARRTKWTFFNDKGEPTRLNRGRTAGPGD